VNRAVFIDRDGTMIEDTGYLHQVEKIAFFPWTIDAMRALHRAGFLLIMVSNQSGVARGMFSEADVETVHRAMAVALEAGGAPVRAYYYCPHHPDGSVAEYARVCDCRKPAAGMVERAARELNVDPTKSFVVGDTWFDVGLARRTGAKAVLVRTGEGARAEAQPAINVTADAIVDNLAAAASWILRTDNPD
jgi:D-glycero-D-manno-heptose 1,7-bisphosphate phosphatase